MVRENELTEFIRKAILDSGKSGYELHKMSGLSVSAILRIANGGTSTLQPRTVAALIKALGIKPSEIEVFYEK